MENVAIIGTVGVPARYGGFETLTHQLVLNLKKHADITVYCSKKTYKKNERPKEWNGVRLIYLPLNANGSQSILYDLFGMIHALFYAETLLVLGVAGAFFFPVIRLFSKKHIVVNIDGLEWKRNKWSSPVRRFLKFSERIAVRFAHVVVTDNAAIQKYVREEYNLESKLIEYGADHVSFKPLMKKDFINYPFLKKNYAFNVCRIEPENNIHLILEAFSFMPAHTLVMVGNWDYSEYGKMLRAKYHENKNIILLEPIYDQRIIDVLRSNCSVYIHGHSAGGTNPSLVEAMHLGLPIIAYDVDYNKETTENKAFYFSSSDDLENIVRMNNIRAFDNCRFNMQEISKRRYSWNLISEKYQNVLLNMSDEKVYTTVPKIVLQ